MKLFKLLIINFNVIQDPMRDLDTKTLRKASIEVRAKRSGGRVFVGKHCAR